MTRALEIATEPLSDINNRMSEIAELSKPIHDFSKMLEKAAPNIPATSFALGELNSKLEAINSLYIENISGITTELQRVIENNQVIANTTARIYTLDFSMISPFHMSLLKLSKTARDVFQPSGDFLRQINYLSSNAAKELIDSDIGYDSDSKKFFLEGEFVSTNRINIVSNASVLFDDISLEDMLSFFTLLSETPHLGLDHQTGKKIFDRVMSLDSSHLSTLDENRVFYRGRKHGLNVPPFVEDEMRRAPFGISGQGRYSSAGIPAFYLSDKKSGAATEVRTHTRTSDYNIQIGVFRNNRRIIVLDTRDWNNALSSYFVFHNDDS